MGHPRLLENLHGKPWLIKPSVHHAICDALASNLNGDLPPSDLEEEEEYEEAYASGGVSIIPVSGVIGKHLNVLQSVMGGCDVDSISLALDAAVADESTSSIILWFDTGGGYTTGVPELADKIAKASEVKNVISFCDSYCCSAGYWLASQSTAFFATPSSEIGSIGVYLSLISETKKLAAEGIEVTTFKGGKYKVAGCSWMDLTEDEKAIYEADIQWWYDKFVEAVTRKRNLEQSTMEGLSYVGEKAVSLNLIDGLVDDIDEVIAMTR